MIFELLQKTKMNVGTISRFHRKEISIYNLFEFLTSAHKKTTNRSTLRRLFKTGTIEHHHNEGT